MINQMVLRELPEGGFLISSEASAYREGTQFLAATTTLEEALKFIKKKLTQSPPPASNR